MEVDHYDNLPLVRRLPGRFGHAPCRVVRTPSIESNNA